MKKQTISKTKIERRMRKKTDSYLVDTIIKLKKSNPNVAKLLTMPKRKWSSINLKEIEENAKENEKILVAGKILSSGNLNKKVKIVAWAISDKAKEKLKDSKSEFASISEEIKKNPELKDLRILR
jgi:large subunit ribosomal protein L18e